MYFHNGDNKATTIFNKNECEFEEVYVSELEDGHYLKSDIPYFFIASNGHLSISSQIKSLDYYDSENDRLETVHLTFITECPMAENSKSDMGREESVVIKDHWLWVGLLILLLCWILIKMRRKSNVKNRANR
jgi:amino acid permease